MKEYASLAGYRFKYKILADEANLSENNAHHSDVSAESMADNAALNSIKSQDSSEESRRWAIEESRRSSIQAGEYKDSIAAIIEAARSYAVGDIGYRDGEETDNAKLYYDLSCDFTAERLEQIQTVVDDVIRYVGLDGEIDVS